MTLRIANREPTGPTALHSGAVGRSLRAPRFAASLALIAVLAALGSSAQAQETAPDEYSVKAVFLFSFGKFVEWPPAGGNEFVIGVIGSDPFGAVLDEIAAKKTVQGKKLVIRRFATDEEFQPPCQILFVAGRDIPAARVAALGKAAGPGVLLVGESPRFIEEGGAVNFFLDGNRVRFEINADAARRAGLRMDARLLNLAARPGRKAEGS